MWDTLDQFLHYLQHQRKYSAHTIESYRNDLSQFFEFWEHQRKAKLREAAQIETLDIRSYLGHLLKLGLEKRSIARKLSSIKSLCRYLFRNGKISLNPASVVSAPKLDRKLPTVLSIEQARELMTLPPEDTFEGLRDRAILELLYGCGLRLSELLQLRLRNIDFSGELIRVLGKGQKERIVPFGRYARQALEAYLHIRAEEVAYPEDPEIVFLNRKGKALYPLAVQKMTRQYMETLSEQAHLSPHVLRHTFATHLLDQGADLLVVKELLGHESLSTTQIYTHVSMDRLKKIYQQAHPRAEKKT